MLTSGEAITERETRARGVHIQLGHHKHISGNGDRGRDDDGPLVNTSTFPLNRLTLGDICPPEFGKDTGRGCGN